MPAVLMIAMLVSLVMYPPLGAVLALGLMFIACSKGKTA